MHATLFAIAFSLLIPADDISGIVVDHDGNAVAGASVIIVDPTAAEKDVATETDAEGKFTFPRNAATEPAVQLLAWKEGYAAGVHRPNRQQQWFRLDLGTKHSDQIRMVLQPQTVVQPVIVDPEGTPVAGAKVTPYYFGEGGVFVYREAGLPDKLAKPVPGRFH
ncbi:MAG TPA: carboxypeptidase-like regulatory domain-containing protein [Planctomycetaceae bacterium]|nr:carboxypeptidase-like regulatory domain-containing protein [Planctomycetaceae bacterium]